jgi:hypothetical protein
MPEIISEQLARALEDMTVTVIDKDGLKLRGGSYRADTLVTSAEGPLMWPAALADMLLDAIEAAGAVGGGKNEKPVTPIAYPNREHADEDKAARRRALAKLRGIIEEARALARRIESGGDVDGSDARRLTDKAADLAVNLSAMETLRYVREWHAADQAEAAGS